MNLPKHKEHKDKNERIKSAVEAVKAILSLDLYPAYKRRLLSECIWQITNANGKYKTRFRSIGSLNAVKGTKLQHEHVIEMRKLILQLLNNEDVEVVLETALGCVVTSEEHNALTKVSKSNPELSGWERYIEAGIRVFDLKEQKEILFS